MLTNKKRLYAEARESGKGQADAARAAGCPEKTIHQAASRYEKDEEIIEHRIRIQEQKAEIKKADVLKNEKPLRPLDDGSAAKMANKIGSGSEDSDPTNFDCPMKYLEHVMNSVMEDPRLRLDAAKTLLPYKHLKKEVSAKKATKDDAAANTAAVSRFRPRAIK